MEWRVESGVESGVEIHAIIRLTTSFGGVLCTMAGVEQFIISAFRIGHSVISGYVTHPAKIGHPPGENMFVSESGLK